MTKLAAKMNFDRSIVGRILREAGVLTHKRNRSSEFSPELEQGQKMVSGKDMGKNSRFDPAGLEVDPLQLSRSLVLSGIFGVS